MKVLKSLAFFVFFGPIFFAPDSEAVIVLKTKNKQALIHLEGLKTKKGAYFEVIDLYGQKRGIVQIKRVARTKAIGVLKYGSMGERWSLEPTSKKRAIALKRKIKRGSTSTARIQKEKVKRKLVRKKLLKKRKLAQKKRVLRRKLASYEGGEYILDDLPKGSNDQSSEVLSYDTSDSDQKDSDEQINSTHQGEDLSLQGVGGTEEVSGKNSKHFILFSITPRFEYNFIKSNPPKNQPGYVMHGPGYGLFASADVSLNRFLRAEGSFGIKQSGASVEEQQCGMRGGCFVTIYYLSAGLNLKLNLMKSDDHKLWLAGGGVLMQPLAYKNNILTPDSFSPFHGALGLGLGVDLTVGDLIIPVSIRGDFYIPPTKTVMMGTVGLHLGLAYKF